MPLNTSPTQALQFGREAFFKGILLSDIRHPDPLLQKIAEAGYTLEEIRPIAEAGF